VKKIVFLLLVISLISVPFQSFAEPFTKYIGRKIGNYFGRQLKEEIQQDKQRLKKALKEHEEREISETLRVLKNNEDLLSDDDIKELKSMVDEELGDEKKTEGSRKQVLRKLKNRLRNKKLLREDHKNIRKKIKEMVVKNHYSEKNYNGNDLIFIPMPTSVSFPSPSMNLSPNILLGY